MTAKTKEALHWIVAILDKHQVPYWIGGGFAASVYGSPRRVNDIDISVSGSYFKKILPDVAEYVTEGPMHYLNGKWDCDTLSLDYNGQEIDMTDVDTLKMSNKGRTEWILAKDVYRAFPALRLRVEGIEVSLMHPRDLAGYKKELDGDHQLVDIAAVEAYMSAHGL